MHKNVDDKSVIKNIALFATIFFISLLLVVTTVLADGWTSSNPSHSTLYSDTITSKTDGSSVNIADAQGLFVTGDVITLGKVGIGTTSPETQLHVNRQGSDGEEVIRVRGRYAGNPTPAGGLGIDWAATYWGTSLFHQGNKVFTVESNYGALIGQNYQGQNAPASGLLVEGNVGIGTTAPGQILDVVDSSTASTFVANFNNNVDANGEYTGISFGRETGPSQGVLGHTYNTVDASRYVWLGVGGDDVAGGTGLIVKKGGNVGSGTTGPGALFEVADATNNVRIIPTSNLQFSRADANYIQARTALGYLNFIVNGDVASDAGAAMTLQSDKDAIFNGNVGIGSTNPGAKATVLGGDVFVATSGNGIILKDTADGTCRRVVLTSGALSVSGVIACPSS